MKVVLVVLRMFLGGLMITSDLVCEHRNRTTGFKVDLKMTDGFIQKFKNDKVTERTTLIRNSLKDLLDWYNYKGSLTGKIKLNDNSTDCYHYHVGYPYYSTSLNGNYSTSDWFILFKLSFDYDRDMFIFKPYDYDHHNRRGNWNM